MNRSAALFASALCLLVHSKITLGNELASYWSFGVFTQAVGIPFFALGFSTILRSFDGASESTQISKKETLAIAAWISLTFLMHFFLGYMLFATWYILALRHLIFRKDSWKTILKRSLLLLSAFFLITSYQWVSQIQDLPLLMVGEVVNTNSRGYGISVVLNYLFKGELFDYKRFPFITILVFISIARAFRSRKYSLIHSHVLLLFIGIVVCAGPATFKSLLYIFPGIHFVHFPRFVNLIQIASIFLVALSLSDFVLFSTKVFINSGALIKKIGVVTLWLCIAGGFASSAWQTASFAREKSRQLRVRHDQSVAFDIKLLTSLDTMKLNGYFWSRVHPFSEDFNQVFLPSIANALGFKQLGFADKPEFFTSLLISKIDPFKEKELRFFNISGLVLPTDKGSKLAFLKEVHRSGRFASYFYPSANGMWDVVGISDSRITKDNAEYKNEVVGWLQSESFSAHTFPTLVPAGIARKWPFSVPPVSGGDGMTAWGEAVESTPLDNQQRATAVLVARRVGAIGLFRSSFHPRWQIRVNGKSILPLFIGPGFVGFELEKGRNECEIVFPTDPVRSVLFIIGMFGLAAIFLFVYGRRLNLSSRSFSFSRSLRSASRRL